MELSPDQNYASNEMSLIIHTDCVIMRFFSGQNTIQHYMVEYTVQSVHKKNEDQTFNPEDPMGTFHKYSGKSTCYGTTRLLIE